MGFVKGRSLLVAYCQLQIFTLAHTPESPPPLSPLPLFPTPPRVSVSKRLSRRKSLLELTKLPLGPKAHPPLPAPPSSAPLFGPSIIHGPLPPLPRSAPSPSKHPHSRTHSQSLGISMMDLPQFAAPNFPRAHTAPSSGRRGPTLPQTPDASVPSHEPVVRHYRNDSEDNWLTATPYGTTPRFSRLGLAAPGVVLPISARASRRKSLRGEGGKRISLGPPAPVMPPRSSSLIQSSLMFCSTPSLLTRSRSRSTTSCSREGNECEDDEVDLALVSPRDRDFDVPEDTLSDGPNAQAVLEHTHDHARAQADPPPTVWGLAMRRHRRSHGKGMSFLSFGSGDSSARSASAISSIQSPMHCADSYFPPGPTIRTARTAPPTPVAEKYNSYLEVDSASKSRGSGCGTEIGEKEPMGTFCRLLRSFSSVTLRT
ncbi:hypothetical protein MSAN_00658600 [Mycena sanguinolenta]|uniref:Uncharacterized protein n=1 Tax=Mycena sanguinolenta TaxID=230812 RepID=A0A8H7DFG4_9AGAR|nr:hypothetical protein MSAN_00658600 [Mycena sanguinolenta]